MSEPNRPLKVFLCHASVDKPAVRELYMQLVEDDVGASFIYKSDHLRIQPIISLIKP